MRPAARAVGKFDALLHHLRALRGVVALVTLCALLAINRDTRARRTHPLYIGTSREAAPPLPPPDEAKVRAIATDSPGNGHRQRGAMATDSVGNGAR
ncbi:hypothetical protein GCM10022225_01930 [Plantactinospora mayteni]|uniref:Uncharacterized protein n=1 Tax=Plantactinospora mayteni TaxID=566021 RepID=A0ABQ4EPV0_9ACTN|nr:hypothetical protein Pma05_32540 [Plantactinospora mayteni]